MDNSETSQAPIKTRKPRASKIQVDNTLDPIEKRRAYQREYYRINPRKNSVAAGDKEPLNRGRKPIDPQKIEEDKDQYFKDYAKSYYALHCEKIIQQVSEARTRRNAAKKLQKELVAVEGNSLFNTLDENYLISI